jgi:hypothetical protein
MREPLWRMRALGPGRGDGAVGTDPRLGQARIGLMTTDQVHYGQADTVHDARQHVLNLACAANPERLVRKSLNPPTNLTPSGSTRRFRNWKAGNKSGHAAAANLPIAREDDRDCGTCQRQAAEAEIDAFVTSHAVLTRPDGRQRIIRQRHHPITQTAS